MKLYMYICTDTHHWNKTLC